MQTIIATPGMQGIDCDVPIDTPSAHIFKNSGVSFVLRYLSRTTQHSGDLSTTELNILLNAGLSVMGVQHVAVEGWTPSSVLGSSYGNAAVANAQKIGLSLLSSIWLDLEEVNSMTMPKYVLDYCNSWYQVVLASGYIPGIYVGSDQPLTGNQLYWNLLFKHYWKSASKVPIIPFRGYQMIQTLSDSMVPQIPIDRDVIVADNFGGLPYLVSN